MAKINISIPQPCHENWEGMTPEDKGRFCDSCQKKVFDFTKSSDREILTAFEQNQNLCGRFLNTQLERDLIKPKQRSTVWLATTTALISLIGLNETTAQEITSTEQTDRRALGKFIVTPVKQEIMVKGQVFDGDSNKLSDVLIQVKNKDNIIYTDSNGFFSAKIMKGDVLIFSKKDYETEQIRFNEEKGHFQLNLYQYTTVKTYYTVGGAITKVEAKKRTFFGAYFPLHRKLI